MKKVLLILTSFLITFCISAQSVYKDYVDGKVYIRVLNQYNPAFNKGTDLNHIPLDQISFLEKIATFYGIKNISKPFFQAKNSDELNRTYEIQFSNVAAVISLMSDIEKTGMVDYAERVPLMRTGYTPNDPSLGTQWHLTQINATGAWNSFNGNSNITVAVVDNAIQTNHTDLTANIWVNPGEIAGNAIDDDNNGYIDDINGWDTSDNDNNPMPPNNTFAHGTHCAGIVGARTDNNVGISAIGFNVKIMAVKASLSTGDPGIIDSPFNGVIYAVNTGARVISCSWGGGGYAATGQAVVNYAWNNGSLLVAAAGNDNTSTMAYPAAYNNVYSVASTTTGDVRSGFTNYGTWVDISAPGSSIYSTVPTNNYQNMSGTSMACPLVAGLCGLVLSLKPYMTPAQVISCINSSATNINSQNPSYIGQLGAGRIEANAARICASGVAPAPPVVGFIASSTLICPGMSVQFFDQSFVGITSWSWTFQGGTPSTSTLQDPIITYPAVGTYSVQLTATNPNGNGTKTMTSYITVSNTTVLLPLVEGFTSSTFPSAGWSFYDAALDSANWVRNNGVGGFSSTGQCAFFNNFDYSSNNLRDKLQTPKYNLTGYSSANMTFDVAYRRYDATFTDSLAVMVSTDCGLTYTQAYMKGGTTLATVAGDYSTAIFTPTSTQWRTETVNLSSYTGQGSVMIAFENRGHYGQPIYIDNINITGVLAGSPPTASFAISTAKCTTQSISFTDNTIGAPTSWAWTFSGGNPANSTLQNPSINYTTAGVYTATLVATNGFGNSTSTQTFTVTNTPTANAGANKFLTCSIPIVQLNGSGGGSYAWSGPSGWNSVLVQPSVINPGTYSLTVTVIGCTSVPSTVTVTSNTVAPAVPTVSQVGNVLTSSSASNNQWFFNGSIMPGETNQNVNVTQNGNYTVQVTDPTNSCVSTSTVYAFGSIGIVESNISVAVNGFPNPSTGQFELSLFFSEKSNVKLKIHNAIGQIVYNEELYGATGLVNRTINLSNYGKGYYLISVITEKGLTTKKIIIE